MTELHPTHLVSDRSDPFGILHLFQPDILAHLSDQSDSNASPAPVGPTGPTAQGNGRNGKHKQNQLGPTGPTAIERDNKDLCLSTCDELEILSSYEERAAIREFDGGQVRAVAEAAALSEVARAAGISPGSLQRRWANHADARDYLGHLTQNGPATAPTVGAAMAWSLTRASQAEARLRAAGLVRSDTLGCVHPLNRTGP